MKRFLSILALAAGLMFAACTPKEKEVAVTGVSVSPTSLSLEVGQSAMLTASVEPSDATDKSVNWTSSDMSVAVVQDGTVKAVATGSASIIVTTVSGGKTATCSVTVKAAGSPDNPDKPDDTVKVESVVISEEDLFMIVGETRALMAHTFPENATNPALEWSTSDPQIVTVDKDGTVTAYNAGNAVITVKSVSNPEAKAECRVTVEAEKAQAIILSKLNVELLEGETSAPVKVTVTPASAGDKSFSVSSSAPSIAEATKVSDNEFTVKGITAGEAEITILSPDGPSAVLPVKVLPTLKEVDLGLPSGVKWSSFNIGATAPEEIGGFYSWGETTPKNEHSYTNYVFGESPYTKYNENDKKMYLDPEDDVATVMYGNGWRTPTMAEVRELKEKCTWTWTTVNKAKGQKITGPNGNSIFLPACGYLSGVTHSFKWEYGHYMILEKDQGPFSFHEKGFSQFNQLVRYVGTNVRAVKGDYVKVTSLKLDVTQIENLGPAKAKIKATMQPSNATDKVITWSSSDKSVATVDQQGNVEILKKGLAAISAQCSAFVATCEIISPYSYVEPDKVDLGLTSGTIWASCNLGAWSPEETGGYFAWGETEPKGRFQVANYHNTGKYQFGKQPEVLQPEDDAAHVKLGGKWRIPTYPEAKELLRECTWKESNEGWTATGPNGKTLYFPKSGYYTYMVFSNSLFHVWTSSLYKAKAAVYLWPSGTSYDDTWIGNAIRPVWADPYPTITEIKLNKHEITPKAGATTQLSATASPSTVKSIHMMYITNNSTVATVSATGLVTIHKEGRAAITLASAGKAVTDVCEIVPEYKYSQPDAIDLGLPSGLKWASCNLGATDPKKPGAYFAWGETQTKLHFTSDNYKWGDDSKISEYPKYNKSDGKQVLDPEDDAAHVILGGDWRMPSMAEIKELVDGCTWTTTTESDVTYLCGKSKANGRVIYFPGSGTFQDNTFSSYNFAALWSRDAGTNLYRQTNGAPFDAMLSSQHYWIRISSASDENYKYGFPWANHRYFGINIRPVKK